MPVLGIDLGASTTVLATIGKGGVAIVRNDLADRLTPTLVSYTNKERLIGDSALTSLKANLKVTAQNFKYLLGAPADWNERNGWKHLLEYETSYALAPFEAAQGPLEGFLGYRVGNGEVVTAVEVLAVFLKKLGRMGAAFLGYEARDVVVAVPSWFPDSSRRAVMDACVIANMNCLGVLNHSTATALDYGLFRMSSFQSGRTHTVAFVDMGYSSCTCSVVEYTQGRLRMRHVSEDSRLGGRALDTILFARLANAFLSKSKCDVRSNLKARTKLMEAAEKTKKVLSANRETSVNMECLMEDEDLNETITREEFENLAGEFRAVLRDFLARTVQQSGVELAQLASIEICGGCTRIPFVQEDIKNVFGGRELSRTISGDECVARGAAIFAAMRSPAHRVADFEVGDLLSHPVYVQIAAPTSAEVLVDSQPVKLDANTFHEFAVFGSDVPIPRRSVWSCPLSFVTPQNMELRLVHSTGTEPGFHYVDLVELRFSPELLEAVRKGAEQPGHKLEFKIVFEVTHNQLVTVSADIIDTAEEPQITKKKIPKKNEEGNVIEGEFDMVDEVGTTYKQHRYEVQVAQIPQTKEFLFPEAVAHLVDKELKLSQRDDDAERARQLANSILSNCFDYRDKLQGVMREFVSGPEKDKIQKLTFELADWVENNPDLTVDAYEQQFNALEAAFSGVRSRYDECVRCDSRHEDFEKKYLQLRKSLNEEVSKKFGFPERCQELLQQMEADVRKVKKSLESERAKDLSTVDPEKLRSCSKRMEQTTREWIDKWQLIVNDRTKAEKAEKARLEAEAAAAQKAQQEAANKEAAPNADSGDSQTQSSDVPMDA
eukprot:Gregarina_sp_Pseudo_9__4779@NODE_49_length_4858_cov_49_896867_g46_i0_p1_GENE_NODE_49_length_4858_cov_49_896867_g46_i0NODE_49_length_4858_cov_49_896867_g46_i0_p1_ORF_typecomplete_len831_score246_94HSP70/PF00012_20/3_6e77HSP70/PF00012_20/6_9e02MreB_Mbl/PF06723_13/1_3e03MreB_Mbl/PF06723_13/8_3e09MreB_Mbl/PF06723_13/2_1e03FGGY_C/PF02782_16/0_0062DUF3670/PF12419_8/2_4e03DUF3670/PF12419_8/0_63DUF3670/PF12419_8/1_3e03HIN/PF02760_15/1_9e03HIN/PF02760_15/0_11CdiI_2/PF18593_1/0_3CdiI_2/PF18593_1/9_4e03Cdi